MTKIIIVTFQGHHNYGAALQAFALQNFLIDIGYHVEFLNFHPSHTEKLNRKIPEVKSAESLLKFVVLLPVKKKLEKRYERFSQFQINKLILGPHYRSLQELRDNPPQTDVYVCGSDQIWNLQNGGNPVYFLGFLKERVPAMTYAASFGTDNIPSEHQKEFSEWIKAYDHLSVRESSAVKLMAPLTKRPVKQVLDPIFLRSREDWKSLAGRRPCEEPYLVFYSLERSRWISRCVVWLARALRLKVVVLGKPGLFMAQTRCQLAVDSGPEEFVSWIYHADFVLTNLFHGTAFSAYFERPVAIIPHSSRNTRIQSLISILKCEEKMLTIGETLNEERLKTLRGGIKASGVESLEKAQKESRKYVVDSFTQMGFPPG